jgi:hypothetical protein
MASAYYDIHYRVHILYTQVVVGFLIKWRV